MVVEENKDKYLDPSSLGLAFYKGIKLKGISEDDIKRLQLNQDKIFGYNNYEDFQSKYFKKGLIAMEDMNKANRIKRARQAYGKKGVGNKSHFE